MTSPVGSWRHTCPSRSSCPSSPSACRGPATCDSTAAPTVVMPLTESMCGRARGGPELVASAGSTNLLLYIQGLRQVWPHLLLTRDTLWLQHISNGLLLLCVGLRNVEIWKCKKDVCFYFLLLSHLRTMQAAAEQQHFYVVFWGDKLGLLKPETERPGGPACLVSEEQSSPPAHRLTVVAARN